MTELLFLLTLAQTPALPPPPPPPAFMTIKGRPLTCFDKPAFEEQGLEFFVCNGGGGLAGVRKKSDPTHSIFVNDPDLAQNLNMQAAKKECGTNRRFAVSGSGGFISFLCDQKEASTRDRFKPASKTDWHAWQAHL